jgi:hypothetical protein
MALVSFRGTTCMSSALLVAGIYSIKLAFEWWFQYGGTLWSPRALLPESLCSKSHRTSSSEISLLLFG